MNSENQPQFENYLAQAAKPEEFDGGQVEPTHDPADSLRKSLASLYENYFQEIRDRLITGSIDLKKADELVAQIDNLSRADLGYEVSKALYLETVKETMGPDKFFGPEEVEKAGIEIREEIPQIPFSPQELKRAQELGQMLIYRTSISINEIDELVRTKLNPNGDENFLDHQENTKIPDYFSEPIPPGWALVLEDIPSELNYQTILGQTRSLVDYLTNQVFQGELMPEDYEIAISEFRSQEEKICRLFELSKYRMEPSIFDLWACKILHGLNINQYFRPKPAEIIYDWLVCFQNTGELLFNGKSIMTSIPNGHGRLAGLQIPIPWHVLISTNLPSSMNFSSNIFSRRF